MPLLCKLQGDLKFRRAYIAPPPPFVLQSIGINLLFWTLLLVQSTMEYMLHGILFKEVVEQHARRLNSVIRGNGVRAEYIEDSFLEVFNNLVPMKATFENE